jgi:hypothetical protein
VIAIRHSVVLGSVLCLSIAGAAQAQDNPDDIVRVLALGDPDQEAFAKHRLTNENVRQMLAVDRELDALWKEVPDLKTRAAEIQRRSNPDRRAGYVAVGVKVHEGIPEIAQILRKHKISAREYVLTEAVARSPP